MVYKIAITGPESTGKTQLAIDLAKHYNTVWVSEYAREYIDKLNRPYLFDDIEVIAKGQIELEKDGLIKANKFLFCDTDILVTKVWSDFVFHKCSPWIDEMLIKNKYSFHLLCDIDLEWEFDPQREHPEKRAELFDIYHSHLTRLNFPFAVIKGIGDQRLQNAIQSINKQLNLNNEVV